MKRYGALLLAVVCCLLTGCASLLERDYVVVEPHSGKFWESQAADILRAEDYQDIVNDLLLLVSRHTESATLRLYQFDEARVTAALEEAAREVQQETPMGAYAVKYITSFVQSQRGYHEVAIQIGYRRSAEKMQSVVNTTSAGAVYDLLESALLAGAEELAVRIGYWNEQSQLEIETAVEQLRLDHGLAEAQPWVIHYYPATGTVGLVEIILREGTVAEEAFVRPSVLPVEDPEAVPEGEEAEQELPEE